VAVEKRPPCHMATFTNDDALSAMPQSPFAQTVSLRKSSTWATNERSPPAHIDDAAFMRGSAA
jgi:hypothetical protein